MNSEDWEARASTKTVSINLANYKPSDKKYLGKMQTLSDSIMMGPWAWRLAGPAAVIVTRGCQGFWFN